MQLKCPKCGGEQNVKNGKVFGWQRYKCKQCGHQFTKISPKGKPMSIKLISHQFYLSGLSMREISKIVGVTAQTVSRWIKKWHTVYMSDIGSREILYHAREDNLLDCL